MDNAVLSLSFFGFLYELFHNTQPLLVGGKLFEVFAYFFEDVISLVFAKDGDNLLDHVLAFLVHGQVAYIVLFKECFLDYFKLLWLRH